MSKQDRNQEPTPLDVVFHLPPDFPSNPVELVDSDTEDALEQQPKSPVRISALRKSRTSDTMVKTLPFRELWVIMLGLCFAVLLSSLDQTIVATVMPVIAFEFRHMDLLAWVATSYMLTSTIMQPIAGKLSDIFGRKILMLIGLVLFLLGSGLCAGSKDMLMLIISRTVQGIGGGMLISLVQVIISDVVSLRDRGTYSSVIGGVWTISSIAGPLMGGVFADKVSWRWAFWINLPIGAVSLLIILFFLRLPGETFLGTLKNKEDGAQFSNKLRSIDYLGATLFILATAGILLATSWGGSMFAWNSPVIIAVYSSAGFLMVVFFVVEVWVASDPIIPPHLFKVRNVSVILAHSFFVGMAMYAMVFYIPTYFQIVHGNTAMMSGLQLLPLLISTIIFSLACGVFITKTGSYRLFVILGAALITTGGGLISTWNLKSNRGHEIGYMVIVGAGLGFTLQASLIAVQAAVKFRDMAVATSLVGFIRSVGGIIGLGVAGALFNNRIQTLLVRALAESATPQLLDMLMQDPRAVTRLPLSVQPKVMDAYCQALDLIFFFCIPCGGLAFLIALGTKHHTIRKSHAATFDT
jgi:EmrB/QacA subfamily drug resistance transporter